MHTRTMVTLVEQGHSIISIFIVVYLHIQRSGRTRNRCRDKLLPMVAKCAKIAHQ